MKVKYFKSAEPNTLVALVGFDHRKELIAADPETYYLKDHYLNHPSVLVRLSLASGPMCCELCF